MTSTALNETYERPGHRLTYTAFEIDRKRGRTSELPECHLLTSLGCDRLEQQLSSRSRVQGGKEPINS